MSFDLTTIYNDKRPLSWSAISSFEWSKEIWWKKYVGKEMQEITPELEFGSYVDKRIQTDPTFLPKLERYKIMQHEMRCEFNGIPLVGYADGFERVPIVRLKDDKTGRKAWDQKRADETGQLTCYAFMLWQMEKIRPENIEFRIDWMPTHYVDKKIEFVEPLHIFQFKTKRTMRDVLKFGQRIMDTYNAMEEYAARRPVLDTCDYAEFMR